MYRGRVPQTHFSRYLLRTTDVAAATAFYTAVLGRTGDGIEQLPEMAIARGARPHWLGHIDSRAAGGAEAMAARFIERGAMRLGPPANGAANVTLRDAGGAILALTDSAEQSSAAVVWHQLNTRDAVAAASTYSSLFGWWVAAEADSNQLGQHRSFRFAEGDPKVGVFSDVEGRVGVHSHWLYFFAVPSLDAAVNSAIERGAVVLGPTTLPNGVRVAVCDDPQGAAFGLIEPGAAAQLARE
jgi:uncharacterized protein